MPRMILYEQTVNLDRAMGIKKCFKSNPEYFLIYLVDTDDEFLSNNMDERVQPICDWLDELDPDWNLSVEFSDMDTNRVGMSLYLVAHEHALTLFRLRY